MCSELRIPGDFDIAQIRLRPDYDSFFYRPLGERRPRCQSESLAPGDPFCNPRIVAVQRIGEQLPFSAVFSGRSPENPGLAPEVQQSDGNQRSCADWLASYAFLPADPSGRGAPSQSLTQGEIRFR